MPGRESYRAGGIRTRDLLHPRQALYQAEPQPELIAALEMKHRTRIYFAYSGCSGKVEYREPDQLQSLCQLLKMLLYRPLEIPGSTQFRGLFNLREGLARKPAISFSLGLSPEDLAHSPRTLLRTETCAAKTLLRLWLFQ